VGQASKEAVLNVFADMLRPLMRVVFEYGISAGELSTVVRRAYIQALETRLLDQNRPTTDARMALIAELSKSEVTMVREAVRSGLPHAMRSSANMDQIAGLLTAWHTHAQFSGAYGLAMDLDLYPAANSPRRSFRDLIDVACPGADADAILDELLTAGSIEIIDGTTLRCVSRAYVPRGEDITRIQRVGRFLEAATASFVHNLLRADEDPVYFDRAVVSDIPLSESGRDQLLALTRIKGQELLAELDTFLARVAASEGSPTGKKYGLGLYFFEDKSTDSESDKSTGDSSKSAASMPEEIDVLAAGLRRRE
jgi:hypothetical protein